MFYSFTELVNDLVDDLHTEADVTKAIRSAIMSKQYENEDIEASAFEVKRMQGCAPLHMPIQYNDRTYCRYRTPIWKGLVVGLSMPMHHSFGMTSPTTSMLHMVCKTSRHSWKHS